MDSYKLKPDAYEGIVIQGFARLATQVFLVGYCLPRPLSAALYLAFL